MSKCNVSGFVVLALTHTELSFSSNRQINNPQDRITSLEGADIQSLLFQVRSRLQAACPGQPEGPGWVMWGCKSWRKGFLAKPRALCSHRPLQTACLG